MCKDVISVDSQVKHFASLWSGGLTEDFGDAVARGMPRRVEGIIEDEPPSPDGNDPAISGYDPALDEVEEKAHDAYDANFPYGAFW